MASGEFEQRIVLRVIDEVTTVQRRIMRETRRTFEAIQDQSRRTERSVQGVTKSFSTMRIVGAGVATFFTGQFIQSLIDTEQQIQRVERALKVATGTTEGAATEIEFLRDESQRLGLEFRTVALSYSQLAAATKDTNLTTKQTREIFLATAEAGSALGLSAADMEGALRAMQQMISKGNVQAEELRGQLGERIPGAFNMAAKAMGVTTKELNKLLETGQVTAEEMLPALSREMRNTFGGQAVEGAEQLTGQMNRLKNSWFELKEAILDSGASDMLIKSFIGLSEAIKDGVTQLNLFNRARDGGVQSTKENRKELASLIEQLAVQKKRIKDSKEQAEFLGLSYNRMGYLAGQGADYLNDRIIEANNEIRRLSKEIKAIEGANVFRGVLDKRDIEGLKEYSKKVLVTANTVKGAQKEVKKASQETTDPFAPFTIDEQVAFPLKKFIEDRHRKEQELIRTQAEEKRELEYEIQDMIIQAQQEGKDRELAQLELNLQRESDILLNEKAKSSDYLTALHAQGQKERDAISEKYAKIERDRNKQRIMSEMQVVSNILQAAAILTSNSKKFAILNRAIQLGQITVNTARAVTQALPNIPLAASIGAIGAAQFVKASSAKFAAKGADFVTSGPELLVVGDNPGGRERVQVTPESSPNINGPKSTGMNVNFGNLSINMQQSIFEQIESNPEEFGRAFARAMKRGALEGVV